MKLTSRHAGDGRNPRQYATFVLFAVAPGLRRDDGKLMLSIVPDSL
jgi:hypothetical protein